MFGGLVFAGQVIWATSAFFPTSGGFYLAIFGRFIFGYVIIYFTFQMTFGGSLKICYLVNFDGLF